MPATWDCEGRGRTRGEGPCCTPPGGLGKQDPTAGSALAAGQCRNGCRWALSSQPPGTRRPVGDPHTAQPCQGIGLRRTCGTHGQRSAESGPGHGVLRRPGERVWPTPDPPRKLLLTSSLPSSLPPTSVLLMSPCEWHRAGHSGEARGAIFPDAEVTPSTRTWKDSKHGPNGRAPGALAPWPCAEGQEELRVAMVPSVRWAAFLTKHGEPSERSSDAPGTCSRNHSSPPGACGQGGPAGPLPRPGRFSDFRSSSDPGPGQEGGPLSTRVPSDFLLAGLSPRAPDRGVLITVQERYLHFRFIPRT